MTWQLLGALFAGMFLGASLAVPIYAALTSRAISREPDPPPPRLTRQPEPVADPWAWEDAPEEAA